METKFVVYGKENGKEEDIMEVSNFKDMWLLTLRTKNMMRMNAYLKFGLRGT